MKRPEILSPAGNFEKMKSAILYGADAVYLAGQIFGMRAAADNFSIDELREAVAYAHERGVKVYLTVNDVGGFYILSNRVDKFVSDAQKFFDFELIDPTAKN